MEENWDETCSLYFEGMGLFIQSNLLEFMKMVRAEEVDIQGQCPTDKVFCLFVNMGKDSVKQKKGGEK